MVKLSSYSAFNYALCELCRGKGQVDCSAALVGGVGDCARGGEELTTPLFKDRFNKPLCC
jgi:hypothetical protein